MEPLRAGFPLTECELSVGLSLYGLARDDQQWIGKSSNIKSMQWSAEVTQCLVTVCSSPEFQEKLESKTRKSKLHAKLID
jgi:hypothetical protein